ncbi:MAG: serine hydrolase domain-containing protein [Methanocalculus sp.]|uniref:serine hydrolase domain-containing protein n=1 Tax=Methanocalculus sp. TaxID=2004547 RepID=UPI0027220571|nr:serine hydrolase domain-containing protein [Methanocalculus sp.]MDO9539156.1 serine hydrolase domain-containing protein [Methanocalculus sp.]
MIRAILLSLLLITVQSSAIQLDGIDEFLNGCIGEDLDTPEIFGAVVAVVSDGEIMALRGYGYADRDGIYPLDPGKTLLPIGSITKLFTWEAAIRLSEKGNFDRDADINRYLPEAIIPKTHPDPITMNHLMTHTSGLDEQVTGLFTQNPNDILSPFQTYLRVQPKRIRPPGSIASYSNSGALLAGAVIESVSGESYEEFVSREILIPYGMEMTAVREPLRKDLSLHAPGTLLTDGIPVYSMYLPAGGMHSTAKDMAAYMIRHLMVPDGYHRIFSHDRRLPGITEGGYFERYRNGERILWHAGDVPGTSTLLALVPEHDLGIYICYTGAGGSSERFTLVNRLLDQYLPWEGEAVWAITGSDEAYTGTYLSSRSPEAGYEKILRIFAGDQITIRVEDEGDEIRIGEARYAGVEPDFFTGVNHQGDLVISHRGEEVWLFIGDIPSIAWRRTGLSENPDLQYGLLILFSGFFLQGTLISIIRAIQSSDQSEKRRYALTTLLSGSALLFLLLFFGTIQIFGLLFGKPPLFRAILWIPMITTVLTLILIVASLKNRDSYHMSIAGGSVLYLLWLHTWSLLIPI